MGKVINIFIMQMSGRVFLVKIVIIIVSQKFFFMNFLNSIRVKRCSQYQYRLSAHDYHIIFRSLFIPMSAVIILDVDHFVFFLFGQQNKNNSLDNVEWVTSTGVFRILASFFNVHKA